MDVSEENENAEEEAYIVENPTLVRSLFFTLPKDELVKHSLDRILKRTPAVTKGWPSS